MATKIRLMRLGKIRAPYYRIVVADSRTKREGRVIETIGKYHPKEEPSLIEVDGERAQYWLSVGAQPTEPVAAILRKTGDWQKFKGEPAPAPLLVAEPKADRKVIFEAAAKEAIAEAEAKPKKAAASKPKKAAEAPAAEGDAAVDATAATEAPADAAVETPVEAAAAEPTATEAVADAAEGTGAGETAPAAE